MVEFIPAHELKNKFDVFGHFYSVQVAPKRVVECRSVLEIVESDHVPKLTAAISNRRPDAVFITMNPGSNGEPQMPETNLEVQWVGLGRVDNQASKIMVAAKWRKARKLRAVLS